jgi:hypothetical protein
MIRNSEAHWSELTLYEQRNAHVPNLWKDEWSYLQLQRWVDKRLKGIMMRNTSPINLF